MSVSTLFFFLSCIAMYKLGAFNARRPGLAWCCCRDSSVRPWKWFNQ